MILITGATGHVGSELVRQLDEGGQPVRVLVRDPARVARLPAHIERVVGDLADPQTLAAAFAQVERVFLMEAGHGQEQTANAVAAAMTAGVRHIVNLSSIGVTLDPMPIMGKWHHDREEIIRSSGMTATFLRPGNFMTNALWWVPSIQAEGVVRDPVGPGRFAPIDPADIAAVAAVALTQDGHERQSYVLTGGSLLTAREQTTMLAGVLGRDIEYVEQTPAEAAAAMAAHGAPAGFVDAARDLNELLRADRIAFVTDSVERLTGRAPASFEDWARRHAPAFG
ncbi:NAD(P)H-binding protein [Nonomuraea sp. NPDC050536]|uniref:NAD(P)H-binding protein n=1 Tax=Nonomuraea sp. NPDC050536 TaxID=3364366 RepID=UPI0037CA853C